MKPRTTTKAFKTGRTRAERKAARRQELANQEQILRDNQAISRILTQKAAQG